MFHHHLRSSFLIVLAVVFSVSLFPAAHSVTLITFDASSLSAGGALGPATRNSNVDTTTGDVIVVITLSLGNPVNVVSITDDQNNLYVFKGGQTNDASNLRMEVWTANATMTEQTIVGGCGVGCNILGMSFTVTWAGTAKGNWVYAETLSNALRVSQVVAAVGSASSGSTSQTVVANAWLVGATGIITGNSCTPTITPGGSQVQRRQICETATPPSLGTQTDLEDTGPLSAGSQTFSTTWGSSLHFLVISAEVDPGVSSPNTVYVGPPNGGSAGPFINTAYVYGTVVAVFVLSGLALIVKGGKRTIP
jgi:hypothetical protein